MSAAQWNGQGVVTAAMAHELVQALAGERPALRLEAGIPLAPALHALKNGCSLLEIMQHVRDDLERYLITQMLVCTQGNKAETARILKIDYMTLYRKMYKYFGTFSAFVPAAGIESGAPAAQTGNRTERSPRSASGLTCIRPR
jgi:transcriptional regulator of acetoin/glycerol metabolism